MKEIMRSFYILGRENDKMKLDVCITFYFRPFVITFKHDLNKQHSLCIIGNPVYNFTFTYMYIVEI